MIMARKAGRTKPMSPKAGVTKTRRGNFPLRVLQK